MSQQDPLEQKFKLADQEQNKPEFYLDGLRGKSYLSGSDDYASKRKTYYLIFFFLSSFAFIYWISRQDVFMLLIKDRFDDFKELALHSPIEKEDLSSTSIKIDSLNQFDQYFIEGQCHVIVAQTIEHLQNFDLSYNLKNQIAECFIHFGLIKEAKSLIEPNIKNIAKIIPSQEEAILQLDHLGDILLLDVYLTSKNFKKKYIENFLAGRCPSWFMSYSCVAKLLAQSLIDPNDELIAIYEQMELKADILNEIEKSYFYLAGAKIYQQKKNNKKSFEAYQKSFLAIPDNRYSFKYMLLSDWIYATFSSKNKKSMAEIKKIMLQKPFNSDKRLLRKYEVIKKLSDPKKERSFSRIYIKNQDFYRLFQDHYEIINALLASALKWKMNKELLSFLGHMLEYYTSVQASPFLLNKLRLWPVRVLIGEKNYKDALVHLDSFIKDNQDSEIFEYFKAVCLLHLATNEKDYLQAFRTFTRSYKLKPSWQAIYGQIESLLRAKDLLSIKIYLDEWEKIKNSDPVSKMWFEVSSGQYAASKENYTQALTHYNAALKKAPRVLSVQEKKAQVLNLAGQKKDSKKLSFAIKKAKEKNSQTEVFKLSAETLFDPMGPMAFW